MERFHRYYSLHRILSSRRLPVPRAAIERELECSRATVNRIIDDLRGYGAPIEYLREQNGYRYTPGVAFELPGIWFNASELYALLAAQKLLAEAEPGLLEDTLAPLRRKIAGILSAEPLGGGEIAQGLRSFALECIRMAKVMSRAARDVPEAKLDKHFATAYGIFAGSPKQIAVLRFTAERARWVADEQWHPRQAGRFLEDGRYELRVPYSDPRELVMDILRYGPDVEVMAPPELRATVAERLRAASSQYG